MLGQHGVRVQRPLRVPDPPHVGHQLVQRQVLDLAVAVVLRGQLVAVALDEGVPQVLAQLVAGELVALVDRQVLGDLRQVVAVVRRHREVEVLRPPLGDLLAGAEQLVGQARARGSACTCACLISLTSAGNFSNGSPARPKPGDVPDPAAAQAHEQRRRPPVVPVAHRTASGSHRPVDLAVALQLVEERRHEPGDGLHRDVALHGEHRREPRPRPAAGREPPGRRRRRSAGFARDRRSGRTRARPAGGPW